MKKHQAGDEVKPEHLLFEAIAAIKDPQEAALFIKDLCTPAELEALADRWRVVAPIKAGDAYRKIYEDTGVSVTTIGRVARFISHGLGGYDLIYERVTKNGTTSKNRNSKKGSPE